MTQLLTFGKPGLRLPKTGRQGPSAALRRLDAGRRHALAWAACALLATPGAQAVDVFTGNRPVYVGSWFNGSFVEVQEFQFALDWAGWCNAHIGSTCSNHRYWNVAGNWDQGAVPGPASNARVEIGDTVRIGPFNSLYQGSISGNAAAATLSAAGRVDLYGILRVDNATFADLHNDRDNAGTLITTGLSTISLLSSGAGRFQGVGGTTRVVAFAPSSVNGLFEPLVGGGHTLQFMGASLATGLAVRLQPGAHFINSGIMLDMAGGTVGLQGTATFSELPTFVNQGGLQGSGTIGGVKFENAGQVSVGGGQSLGMGSWGEHSGHFSGTPGSSMSFVGTGSAGHTFAAGSDIASGGAVNFGAGNHRVTGGFSAGSSSLNTGTLTFDGERPVIGRFELGGGGTVALRTAGGAAINELVINGDFTRFDVDSGAPLALQRLQLLRGSFNVRAPVSLASSVDWRNGYFVGNEPVTSTAAWRLLDGDRAFRGNVSSSGDLSWEGGRFTEWSGRFVHQAGAQFNILGDFSSAGGAGGKLANSGTVSKLAGPGRSELAMGFDTIGGTVRSLSGTLALTGGGTHTDASFSASQGAAIELAGGTTFGSGIQVSGPLHLAGGNFTLLPGTSYAHAAGNRFEVADLSIPPLAQLSVAEEVWVSGNVNNLGSFTPANHVHIQGDFLQQGNFDLHPGKELYVQGSFTNHGALTVQDAYFIAGTLVNHARIDLVGNSNLVVGSLDNQDTLVLGPTNGYPGVGAWIYGGRNSGTLRVDGTLVDVRAYDLHNTGQISNEGTWYAGGSFIQTAGGRFNNAGQLTLDGNTTLLETTSLHNSGSVRLQAGALDVRLGAQIDGPGSFEQLAGVSNIGGRLQAGGGINILGGTLKGTGTLEGDVYIDAAAQWTPGNSPGTMTVLGNVDLRGALALEIDSRTRFDRVVVSGNFVAYAAAIDLHFGPGYQPQDLDIDSLDWLSTGGYARVDTAALNVSGLPTHWQATLTPSGQIQLNNSQALQIPVRGSHAIGASDVHFNAIGSNTGQYPILDRLDNAGYFHNRSGAVASIGLLNNDLGATLVNRGYLYAETLNNSGQLNNRAGGELEASALNNSGSLVNEGNARVYGPMVNEAGGVIEQRGTLIARGLVRNDGQLRVSGAMTGFSVFNNYGEVQVQTGGSIESAPNGSFWQSYGELRVDGLLRADDLRIFGGRLSGNGRLESGNLVIASDIDPGNSVGLLTVDGNLTANGNVHLEIAGGDDYDRLVVHGNADFNGGLSFQLLGDYRPTVGDSFSPLVVSGASSYAGSWRFETEDGFGGWRLWADANGFYDPAVPGDWRASFSNGTVSITAVPEPSPLALLMAGLGVVVWVARRRQLHPGPGARVWTADALMH